jgi:hypothetical protein
MIPAKQLLNEIIASLRNVIAPANQEPYPKAQAYMAAVILEFVGRQVEERTDIEQQKEEALHALFDDLSALLKRPQLGDGAGDGQAELCRVIERLYEERSRLGEEKFTAANRRIRQALRLMLDRELQVAGRE